MKAISLWQPWASLWIADRKLNETRHWATSHRGPLLMHAAKKICLDLAPELLAILKNQFGPEWARVMPRGAILGCCELTGCVPTSLYPANAEERAQGNYSNGRYAWTACNKVTFCEPIQYRGFQAIFNVPVEIVAPMLTGGSIASVRHPQGSLLASSDR